MLISKNDIFKCSGFWGRLQDYNLSKIFSLIMLSTFSIVVVIGLFVLFTVGILRKRKFKGLIECKSFKMKIEAED
jgi:hypothetical protein